MSPAPGVQLYRQSVDESLCRFLFDGESYTSFWEGPKKHVNEGDTVLVDVSIDGLAGG